MGDPGVTEIVDGSVIYTGEFEVAINGGADVADEKGTTVFGDEQTLGFLGGLANSQPAVNSGFGGFVEGNYAAGLGFVRFDDQMVSFDVVQLEVGQFTDANAGLEEDFDDSGGTFVAATGVTESAVFGLGEDSGGFVFVLGVFDLVGGIVLNMTMGLEEAEKALDRVNFAGNGFGGVVLFGEMLLELVEMFGFDEVEVLQMVLAEAVFYQLLNVFAV
jgi:hypothetical protein